MTLCNYLVTIRNLIFEKCYSLPSVKRIRRLCEFLRWEQQLRKIKMRAETLGSSFVFYKKNVTRTFLHLLLFYNENGSENTV
jgi:hypothetical protein